MAASGVLLAVIIGQVGTDEYLLPEVAASVFCLVTELAQLAKSVTWLPLRKGPLFYIRYYCDIFFLS